MKAYLVTYNLKNYTKYYPPLSTRLKKFPRWAKLFQRTWVICSSIPISRIRTILSNTIEDEGRIIVIEITGSNWAALNIDDDVVEWLKENI